MRTSRPRSSTGDPPSPFAPASVFRCSAAAPAVAQRARGERKSHRACFSQRPPPSHIRGVHSKISQNIERCCRLLLTSD
jgi:hypothetical protein